MNADLTSEDLERPLGGPDGDDKPDEAQTPGPPVVVGFAAELQGGAGQVVAGYLPDHQDLRALARHWYQARWESQYFCYWVASCRSGSDWRYDVDCSRRLERIEAVVGEAEIRKVYDEVLAEERRKLGEENWRIIHAGTPEEQDRYRDSVDEGYCVLRAKEADEPTWRAALEYLSGHPTGVYFDGTSLWYLALWAGGGDPEPGRLVLKVRTTRGVRGRVAAARADRPPGWFSPYGLR